jgi:hypothetical protein
MLRPATSANWRRSISAQLLFTRASVRTDGLPGRAHLAILDGQRLKREIRVSKSARGRALRRLILAVFERERWLTEEDMRKGRVEKRLFTGSLEARK